MEIKNYYNESNIISREEQKSKIREKLKTKEKIYYKRIKNVLNYFNKICNIRGTYKFFDIPKSTVFGWVKKKNEYMNCILKQ